MERTKKTTSAFRLFENRRKYPRIRVNNLPVKVTGAGGKILKATLHDISPDGAQIRYMISEGLNLFLSENARVEEIKSVKCTLEFVLGSREEKVSVKLTARPVYIRTVSQRVMTAGMMFTDNDLSELKKVSDYLFHQIEKSYSGMEGVIEAEPQEGQNAKPTDSDPPVLKEKESVPEAANDERGKERESQPEQPVTQPPKIDLESLHKEVRRLASNQKILLETIRRFDDRMLKIEEILTKKSE